jgi:hypothetical protein
MDADPVFRSPAARTRLSSSTASPSVESSRVRRQSGDFYMAGDARYSTLTGVAGEGEQDSPRQPYASEYFALLLEYGAEPFDIQVLYDALQRRHSGG